MARVALTDDNGALYGAPANWLGGKLSERAPATLPEAGPLLAKLHRRQSDATILVLGDSTGQGDFDTSRRWPLRFAEKLAATFPAYTVRFHMWNSTTTTYDAPADIHVGDSGKVLHFYNGSAAGQTANYSATHFAVMAPAEPDVVIINHGHNHALDANFLPDYRNLVELTRMTFRKTPIILTAQNPRTKASGGYTPQLKIREIIANYVGREGFGYIDAASLFEEYGDYETALMADEIHPNENGYELWASHVADRFSAAATAVSVRQHQPKQDYVWYSANAFDPSSTTDPAWMKATAALPLSGWSMDQDTAESVTGTVLVPDDWNKVNFHLFWTSHDTNTGAVSWRIYGFTPMQLRRNPAATFPMERPTATTIGVDGGGAPSTTNGVANTIYRQTWTTDTSNAYTFRGLHGLRVQRIANSGADTKLGDAVFVGVLFERVE